MNETEREQLMDRIFSHDFKETNQEVAICIHLYLWANWMQIPEFATKFKMVSPKSRGAFTVGTLIGTYEDINIYVAD